MKYLWLLLLLPSCSTPPVPHERYGLDLWRTHMEWPRAMHPTREQWRLSCTPTYELFDLNKDWKVNLRDVAELQNYFERTVGDE